MNCLLVVTGWNCSRYIEKAMQSIKMQTRQPDYVVIVDDGSQDNTFSKIYQYTDFRDSKFQFYTLPSNYGTTYARDYGIRNMIAYAGDKIDVIIMMDLDDELNPNAIERVMRVYEEKPKTWLTYGNYVDSDNKVCFSSKNIEFKTENFRQEPWKFVHLRSFRKELYFQLTKEDLFVPNTPVYPDANMLYCLLELASKEHITPIVDVLYKYNHDQPFAVLNRFNNKEQRDEELMRVQSITPKQKLESL